MSETTEFIKLKKVNGKTTISGQVLVFRYKDKATDMNMSFVPSLNISGYGDTLKEADEMVDSAINDYLLELVKCSIKSIKKELLKYGWSSGNIHTKVFQPKATSESKMDAEGIKDYVSSSLPLAA